MFIDTWVLFEHGINLLQGIMFAYFVCSSLEFRWLRHHKQVAFSICSLLVFAALTICNKVVFYEGIAIFIYALILFLFNLIFMKGSILHKLFVSVVPVNAMAVGSIFSTNLMSLILNKQIIEFLPYNTHLRVITVLISNAILFTILYVIKRVTSQRDLFLKESEWFLLSFELILSVVAYMFLYYSIFSSNSIMANFFIALSVAAIIIINITTYILLANYSNRYQIQLENTLLKQKSKYQENTICETKRQYEELQKIKHDFNNTIKVIQNLNSQAKHEEIDAYIKDYLKEQLKTVKVVHTGNSFIDAIINTKLAETSKRGVEVNISVISDIDTDFNIDLCNLIGNMFDNAIRACINTKNKIIKFDIRKANSELILSMKNTIVSSVLTINPDLVSDKPDVANHGLGTKIIREIAAKHNGLADFYEEDEMFCCNVILYI